MYADDSSFFLQGTKIDNIITGINTETENILTWLEVNRLSLSTKKSKWVLFDCAKNRGQVRHDWQIKIRGEIINQVENIKFLGIILDERLSWKEHVRYISTKLAKSIGILGKAKNYICKKLLRLSLYYSFIYPHLNYVVSVWGNCAQIHLKSVVKMQKKAVCFIDSAPPYTSTEPLFNKYLLLSLEKIYIYNIGTFMYKFRNSLLPRCFDEMFKVNKSIYMYNTRQSSKYHVPVGRCNSVYSSIRYKGVDVYNNIVSNLGTNCSMSTFKRSLKAKLIQ